MGNKNLYGEMPSSQFGISGDRVVTKRLKFNTNEQPPSTVVQVATSPSAISDVNLVLPEESGTIALQGESAGNGFQTIQVPSGTSPVATGPNDTLTLSNGTLMNIVGDSTTDTVTVGIADGTANTFLGRDASGVASELPNILISSTSGGITQTISLEPSGAGGDQILINPEPKLYEGKVHLINPDLRKVRGVSPELWDIVDSAVVSTVANRVPSLKYANEDELWSAIDEQAEIIADNQSRTTERLDSILMELRKHETKTLRLLAAILVINVLISLLI